MIQNKATFSCKTDGYGKTHKLSMTP